MSIVTLEFDNTLEKSEIIVPLKSTSAAEGGEANDTDNQTDRAQTSVFGIQSPLIMINSTVIDFDAVQQFSLKSTGILPTLTMMVEDRFELINNIDKLYNDNEVRVQILPRFDNAYKKIDLTFFITNVKIIGSSLQLTCSYKLPALTGSQYKTFGEIDTYTLFKNIATETKLGFATNVAQLDDKRYIYCDNKSYVDIMESEIEFSIAPDYILDWWVDLWDNINLVDIKERYNTIDSDDDLKIWIAPQTNEVTEDIEVQPHEVTATLNNYPGMGTSELYVKEYVTSNKPGMQLNNGTDRVYGIYENSNLTYNDHLIQDGDIKRDIFVKYEYVGENFGEYNYLLSKQLRAGYLQKISSETIKVTLQSPLLGLMRGHKVNFVRYVDDDKIEQRLQSLEDAGVIDRSVETNIPLSEYEDDTNNPNGQFRIDKTVSGQYLIKGVDFTFKNNNWEYTLTLVKPADTRTSIINE